MADPHAHDHAAHQHGSQEISEQAATYSLFMGMAKWGSLAIACLLLFLTLAFHHGGSLLTGLIGAVVLFAVGFFALKSKPAH